MAQNDKETVCIANCLNNARVNRRNPDRLDNGDAPLDLKIGGKCCGFTFSTVEAAREAQRTHGGQIVGANGTLFGGW